MSSPVEHRLSRAFAEVARSLQAPDTAAATLQRTVELALEIIPGCDHAGVSLVEGDLVLTPAATGDVAVAVDRIQYETDQGPCLSAVRQTSTAGDVSFVDASDLLSESRWPEFSARAVAETGVRSMLSFQLSVQSEVMGALNLYSHTAEAFDRDSHLIGAVFAGHASVALAGARAHDDALGLQRALDDSVRERARLSEQAVIAAALQDAMITALPRLHHLQLEAVYRPAGRDHQVGGDWYDAFVQPDGATALVIGDVTGHDIAAAATMGAVRNLLRGIAYDRAAPPAQTLSRVDAAVAGLSMEAITSVVLARLELVGPGSGPEPGGPPSAEPPAPEGLLLRWSNAGHPPPLVLQTDGAVEVLERPTDLLLGVRSGTLRADHRARLAPGATLLMYTDGLVERRGEHLDVGIQRLARTVASLAGRPLAELLARTVHALVGDGAEDDTAVLGVRVAPGGAPSGRV